MPPAPIPMLSLNGLQTWRRAANLLRGMGHTVVDVSLPCTQFALATYYVVAPAEAARRAC